MARRRRKGLTSGAAPPPDAVAAEKNSPAPRLSLSKKLLFSLVPLVALLMLIEGGLRLAGFERPTAIESMQFTFSVEGFNADARVPILIRDEVVFWKPRPGLRGHNSHGTTGPEFAEAKPPGTLRIVCLGDSCTHYGPAPYPERWQRQMNAESKRPCEVINAGVIGYTSYQGLRRLETEVAKWSPDVITVYFGWNDHWLARGFRDSQQRPQASSVAAVTSWLDHSRTFQLVSLGVAQLRTAQAADQKRVELDEYEQNLRAMVEAGRKLNAQVWLITAAHALDRGIPDYLTRTREVDDIGGLIAMHERYNESVRRVGKELNAPLIDFAALVASRPDRLELFDDDHIHLSSQGKDLLAEQLLSMAVERGMLEGGRPNAARQRPANGLKTSVSPLLGKI